MLLARHKTWFLILAVWASSATWAFAQPANTAHWSPFGPSSIRYDLELFKPPDLSTYGDWPRPNEGLYFSYERLYYSISQPNRTEIGVPGGTATGLLNGVINFDPTNQPVGEILESYNNSLDTGFLRADQTWGNRFEFGFMEDGQGWNMSILNLQDQIQTFAIGDAINPAGITMVFRDPRNLLLGFVDTNGDGFDDDLNISGAITPFNRVPTVFGRPTGSPPTGPFNLDTTGDGIPDAFAFFTDFGDQVRLVPIFNTIVIQNITSLNSVEVNRAWRYPPNHRGNQFTLNAGVRWMILRDAFNVAATATLGSAGIPPAQGPTSTGPFAPGLPGLNYWNTAVDNNMFGPQIALRWDHTAARWDVFADLRFMAAINFQSTHLNGELASLLDPIPGQPTPGGPLNPINAPFEMVRTSFHSWRYDMTFAPVGEVRVGVNYKLTQAIGVQAGYNAIIGAGVSRASRRIDYVLPALQILDDNKWDTFFTNGLSLGVTINR
jgi:hypothetical protein